MKDIYQSKLKNGLRYILINQKGAGSVTVHLRGLAGSRFEKNTEVGASHILEHLLLNNKYRDKVFNQGGKIVGVTGREDILFMVKVRKTDLEIALEYLSSILKSADIDNKTFSNEKKVVIEEIRRFSNVPEKLIGRLSYQLLFPKQRVSSFNTGNINDLNKLSLTDVLKFKDRLFHASNFILSISGDTDRFGTEKLINKYYSSLEKAKSITLQDLKKDNKKGIQNIVNKYFNQNHIKIDFYGYPLSSNVSVYKKSIYTEILSRVINNYLRTVLKENMGLSYILECTSFSSGGYGILGIYLATSCKEVPHIINTIFKLLGDVSQLFTNSSIDKAKKQYLLDLEFSYEKTSFRAEYYSRLLLHGVKDPDIRKEIKIIEESDRFNILQVYKEIFSQKPKITILSNRKLIDSV